MRAVLATLVLLLGGCATTQDWNFVQSVGGITIGTPQWADGEWMLPVHADASGLINNGVQPTTLNSALACKDVKARRRGSTILLALRTNLVGVGGGHGSACPPVHLGRIKDGEYTVKYGASVDNAVPLGSIRIQTPPT